MRIVRSKNIILLYIYIYIGYYNCPLVHARIYEDFINKKQDRYFFFDYVLSIDLSSKIPQPYFFGRKKSLILLFNVEGYARD